MIYESSAPTRMDLAGGTLDIWPIYVLENGGLTVNAALNMRAVSRLKMRDDKKILITSKDRKESIEFENISKISHDKLDLITRIIEYYKPEFGFELETKIGLPTGTGLGASSSLGISLMHLFNKLTNKNMDEKRIIQTLSNIEAQTIGMNTGKQDYYPATYGGINAIRFEHDGDYNEKINLSGEFLKKISGSFIICFTGNTHCSATNNWNMLKRYMENDAIARNAMKKIKQTAFAVKDALKNEDFDALVRAIEEEGNNRRNLAEGVITPQMDKIINEARKCGAIASKPLGAGGGGCMLIVCREGTKQDVIKSIEKIGAKNIDFEFDEKGVDVRVLDE